MKQIILIRIQDDGTRTLGEMLFYNDFSLQGKFVTLELPWKQNERQVSCIYKGEYQVVCEEHPKFGKCLRVLDVPGRTGILIHAGNVPADTHGCILVGLNRSDIDGDGRMDITSSRAAVDLLYGLVKTNCKLTVI